MRPRYRRVVSPLWQEVCRHALLNFVGVRGNPPFSGDSPRKCPLNWGGMMTEWRVVVSTGVDEAAKIRHGEGRFFVFRGTSP